MDIGIRMRLVNKGELVAVGDVCLDNMVILHQVKVLTLGGKTVISFPEGISRMAGKILQP